MWPFRVAEEDTVEVHRAARSRFAPCRRQREARVAQAEGRVLQCRTDRVGQSCSIDARWRREESIRLEKLRVRGIALALQVSRARGSQLTSVRSLECVPRESSHQTR